MNPLIINLYGAPGAGKSTGGAYIYSELKKRGIHTRMIWLEELEDELADGTQWLEGTACTAVQIIDNLTKLYMPEVIINIYPLGQILIDDEDLANNYYDYIFDKNAKNYLLLRVKSYIGDGRNHTEEESNDIGRKLRRHLDVIGLKHSAVGGHKEGYDCIIDDIIYELEKKKDWERFQQCY